jgi:hypothetical protein
MGHRLAAFAGSPRRGGNSESLLDSALAGVAEADPNAEVRKFVLNEMTIRPCQNCGFCSRTGYCRFAESDDMKDVYAWLDEADRFILASPIYFATVSAQTKTMMDRCQAIWARKYLLKKKHSNPDREALFLSCGGFDHDRFYRCTRQVVSAWCAVADIKLAAELFYPGIDAKGAIQKHPSALAEARAVGRTIMS